MLKFKPFFLSKTRFETCRDFEHIDVFGQTTSFQVYVRNRNIDEKHDFSYINNFEINHEMPKLFY